jgi:SAM-dependent methyltransferase
MGIEEPQAAMSAEESQAGLPADACPLCGGHKSTEIRALPILPIGQYWEALGYRLEQEHGNLPNELVERRCIQCGLHFFHPCLIGSSKLYERLAAVPWYYGAYKWEFDEALKFLAARQPVRVLEIGCGQGAFLKQARRFSTEVKGFEYSKQAIETCRESGLNVVLGSVEDLDEPVDILLAFQVVEHLENPGKVLEGWIEHIVPGGHLVVAVPNQDGVLGQVHDNYLNLPPHHASLWEEQSLRFIAERFNLEITHYLREPLSLELYATYTQSLLKRTPVRSGMMGKISRLLLMHVHRGLIPYFYETAGERLAGHTHMAIYRKAAHSPGGRNY